MIIIILLIIFIYLFRQLVIIYYVKQTVAFVYSKPSSILKKFWTIQVIDIKLNVIPSINKSCQNGNIILLISVLNIRSQDTGVNDSIMVGVIAVDPENLEIPWNAYHLHESTAWILYRSSVRHEGKSILEDYRCDLNSRVVGDRIGVQRTGRGELRIHVNGIDQGVAAVNVPEKVYAVVDVYWGCKQVTVVPSARGET